MIKIAKSIEIDAPTMIVWNVMSKHLEHPDYPENTTAGSVLIHSAGGVPLTEKRSGLGVRTRWNYEFKGRHYTWDDEVIGWEEGKLICWKATSMWTMLDSFELAPTSRGTRVVYMMEYRFPFGPLGWLVARLVYHRHIQRSVDETLRGLKSSAERIALLRRTAS